MATRALASSMLPLFSMLSRGAWWTMRSAGSIAGAGRAPRRHLRAQATLVVFTTRPRIAVGHFLAANGLSGDWTKGNPYYSGQAEGIIKAIVERAYRWSSRVFASSWLRGVVSYATVLL